MIFHVDELEAPLLGIFIYISKTKNPNSFILGTALPWVPSNALDRYEVDQISGSPDLQRTYIQIPCFIYGWYWLLTGLSWSHKVWIALQICYQLCLVLLLQLSMAVHPAIRRKLFYGSLLLLHAGWIKVQLLSLHKGEGFELTSTNFPGCVHTFTDQVEDGRDVTFKELSPCSAADSAVG